MAEFIRDFIRQNKCDFSPIDWFWFNLKYVKKYKKSSLFGFFKEVPGIQVVDERNFASKKLVIQRKLLKVQPIVLKNEITPLNDAFIYIF